MLDIIAGELPCYVQRLSRDLKRVLLVPTSDVHYGSTTFSLKWFLQHRAAIERDPEMYTVLNGDLCECVTKASKGDVYTQKVSPQDQRDWTIDQWYPLRHKVLACTMGNHEARIYNETGIDICADIAKALGVPYRPEGLLLRIVFGGGNDHHPEKPYVYTGYFTHGYGGARTNSAKAVKVERTSSFIHADYYCMSHDHVVNAAPVIYLMPDARSTMRGDGFEVAKVTAHRKMLVKSNAFLKWGGYSERGGFPPVDLETPIIKLAGEGRPKVKVEV